MTVAEVAKLWRQRRETIYRKIADGSLRAVRLGDETAALRVPRDEIERIRRNASESGTPRSQTPAERREPQNVRGQSSARAYAGAER
jgi:excisionase family DNA binding protein